MKKSSRVLNDDYLEIETEVNRLKNGNSSIELAYSEFQSITRKEQELWEQIRRLSIGTEAHSSVLKELDYLDEEIHFFNGKLVEGEENLEQELNAKIKQRDQLEEAIFQARKEENECLE